MALTTASVVLVYFGYVYGLARGAEYVATLAVVGAAAAALLHAAYGAEGARAGGRRARAGAPAAELAPASLAAYAIGAVNFWFFAGAVGAGWAFRSFVPHAGALANDRVYGLSHGVVATLLPAVAAWASGKTRYF